MAQGKQTLDEKDVLKYNELVLYQQIPREIVVQVSKLLGMMRTEEADVIRREQLELHKDFFKDEEEETQEPEVPVEKPKVKKAVPKDDASIKANRAYRALQKTEAIRLLKEEVLLAQDHTCLACESKISTRSEHKKISDEPYPLIVRCVFPPHKYIEAKRLFEPKAACTDKKLLNPNNYVAVCINCKPMNFSGKYHATITQ